MEKKLMLIGIILLLIVPCSFPIISGDPGSEIKIFYPTDDTYVKKEDPGGTRGDREYMVIRNEFGAPWDPFKPTGYQIDGLIKFDVSSVPLCATIVSATLNLYYYEYQHTDPNIDGRNLKLYRVWSDWDEDTVTWNTRPVNQVLTASADLPSLYNWMSWDVTDDVQNFIDGTEPNYGWKIHDWDPWEDGFIPTIFFRTKEYGSNIPYLEIEYIEPVIIISSPNGLETWYKGETHTITWDSENTGNSVKIELYKNGLYVSAIISGTSNDGSYSWTIPSSLSTSSSYKIKITSTSCSSVYDESNYFFIDERYITVNSPYSGNKWFNGETHSITWSSKNAGGNIKIELYKSGSLASTITSSTSNDGSYTWKIPSSLSSSSSYKIKITSTSDSSIYDESSYFSIDDRYITVKSPDGGETCYKGEASTINWNSDNAGSHVKIELYKNSKYHSTIVSSTSNDDSYTWKIPSSLSSSSSYKIKITSTSNSNVYDYSNTYLTIKETWLQKWQWAIAIAVLIIVVLIGVGIGAHVKSKEKKRVFEKKKKEIKEIIHKATSEKKKEQRKTEEKKKGEQKTEKNEKKSEKKDDKK